MATLLQHNKHGTHSQPTATKKGSCNKFYSMDKNRERIGLKHGKNPYPLERIISMASYHSKHEMINNLEPKSYCIALDSHCYYSIARRRNDFIADMKSRNIRIEGITGTCMVRWKVTW